MKLFCALLPLLFVTATEARGRGGKGGGGGGSIDLNLEPVDTATLVFYILFAIVTAGQLISALGQFKKRQIGYDYPRRIPVILFIFLTTCSLLTADSLGAYLVSQSSPTATGDYDTVVIISVMNSFTSTLVHVFFLSGIFLILDWRCHQQAAQYGHTRSRQFATAVRFGSAALLFVMLICIVARAGIGGSGSRFSSTSRDAYGPLYHIYVTMFVLAVITLIGTTIVLWTNRRPQNSTYELLQFDDTVLSRILHVICPFLAIQALYQIIYDIIAFAPDIVVYWPAFNLANVLIEGIIFLTIIHVAIHLGLPPKQKDKGQVRAEVKGQESSPLVTGSTYVNK